MSAPLPLLQLLGGRCRRTCPACAAPYLEQAGFGTERVEQEIAEAFPAARVARLDRDTVRKRGRGGRAAGARSAAARIDVLVGTQMIAKGHDFPRVTLVGVVSADVGLGMADFRAAERTFQLLTQVVGRAGRGEEPGEAIVQTLYPGTTASATRAARTTGPSSSEELAFRRAMRYPPQVALHNGIVRAQTMVEAMRDAARARRSRCGGRARRAGSPCWARRRRRSRNCAASTARSSS